MSGPRHERHVTRRLKGKPCKRPEVESPEPISPVPSQPWSTDPAQVLDGSWGTPPLRNLEGWTKDVSPAPALAPPPESEPVLQQCPCCQGEYGSVEASAGCPMPPPMDFAKCPTLDCVCDGLASDGGLCFDCYLWTK